MICRPDTRITFALALACLFLPGCEEAASQLTPVEQARAELAQGNPLAAEILLEAALEQGVPRADVAAFYGEAELQAGDLLAAREWLAAGEFSEAARAHGFRMLGRLEMREGNLPAAGAAFDRAYQANAQSADLWVDIGRLRYRGGEQVQAIEAADKALQLEPENGEALRFRGQLARDAEGMQAGAALLGKALETRPQDIELRVEYAATLGDAGRASEALSVLRANGGEAALMPRGLLVQAVIAARAGLFMLSRDLLVRSQLEQDRVPAAQLLSAIIDFENGNFASAAQTLDRLYSLQPDNRRVRDLLAAALSRSNGERELVHRFAGPALQPSGSAYLRTLVGQAYEALDDRTRAAQFLDLAALGGMRLSVLPSPSQPALNGPVATNGAGTRDYVRAAIAQQELAAAVRRARDFSERFPGSADALGILGDAQLAKGDKAAARRAYERAASVRRPWPLALRLAGTQDSSESVRALLTGYVRNNPMNGEAAAVLADAFAAEGDWDTAVILLDHAIGLGMARVPWVLAARSIGALQQDDPDTALAYALAAHELQPMNPLAVSALIASLPQENVLVRAELQAKLTSIQKD